MTNFIEIKSTNCLIKSQQSLPLNIHSKDVFYFIFRRNDAIPVRHLIDTVYGASAIRYVKQLGFKTNEFYYSVCDIADQPDVRAIVMSISPASLETYLYLAVVSDVIDT